MSISEARIEKQINPDEESIQDELCIECYDTMTNIYYLFDFDDQDNNNYFIMKLQQISKTWPLFTVIELKIYNSSNTNEKPFFEYTYLRTQSDQKESLKSLETNLLITQCYSWHVMKLVISCRHIPNHIIPIGLSSKYNLCYLNSVLQMLYNIPKFRQLIFSYPTVNYNQTKPNIILALQRLFSQMSNSNCNKPEFIPCALELTKSFGWSTDDLSEEQDANEFMSIFLQKIRMIFSSHPDLSKELNMLFDGKLIYNSKIENFNSLSLSLSTDLKHSLKLWTHPNNKDRFSKLYFSIKKFIEAANIREPMPPEYQVFANALINILSKRNEPNSQNNNDTNNDENILITNSIVKILNEKILKKNQPYSKISFSLHDIINIPQDYQFPSETAKNLSKKLSSSYKNHKNNDGNDIIQLICDFYLDSQIEQMAGKTNYFIELPRLLIFKIQRFHEVNGEFKKNDGGFKFPKTFSMKDYLLPQNDKNNYNNDHNAEKTNDNNIDDDEYELFSVISHRGELNSGHYIEFSRNTTYPELWFKIDEKNVSLVSEKEAIDGNFGEIRKIIRSASENPPKSAATPTRIVNRKVSGQLMAATPKRHLVKPLRFNAYMLLYIHKKFIKDIIDVKVKIPEHLKDIQIAQKTEIVQPPKVKIDTIRLMTADSIADLIEIDNFCMKNTSIIEKSPMKIDLTKVTLRNVGDLYNLVSQKMNLENDENNFPFILWTCLHGFNPNKPLTSLTDLFNDAIHTFYDTFIIVQQKDENYVDRPFSIYDRLFYLLFFDPFNPIKLKFIGLVVVNTDHSIDLMYPEFMNKIKKAGIQPSQNKPLRKDQSIEVFYERKRNSAIHLMANTLLNNAFSSNSSNLIVQFSYQIDSFENDLNPNEDHSLCDSFNYEDGHSYTKYMMQIFQKKKNKSKFNPLFADYYYKMHYLNSLDITFHRISTGDHITLKVPKSTTMLELSKVLYRAFIELEAEKQHTKMDSLLAIQPISTHIEFLKKLIFDISMIKEKEDIDKKLNKSILKNENKDENDKIKKLALFEKNVMAQLFNTNQNLLYPSTVPIQIRANSQIYGFFPRFYQHVNIFFELLPKSIFESQESNDFFTMRVEISDDSIMYSKIHQIIIDNNNQTTYSNIAHMVGIDPNNLLKDSEVYYRILMITNGKILKSVFPDEKVNKINMKNYVIRFERVPEDQKPHLNPLLIRVHYGITIDQHQAKLFGVPFYFTLHKDESEDSLYERLKQDYMKFVQPDENTGFVITNQLMEIMNDFRINSSFYSMVEADPNSLCICILMNDRVDLRELISMEKASSKGQLKIYT